MTTQELVERLKRMAEENYQQDFDTCAAAASRLSEMDAEIKRLREALAYTREALFSALAGSNAAGDAETVDDVLKTLQWMADNLNPAYSLCVSVLDGRRAEYDAALEHQQKGEKL